MLKNTLPVAIVMSAVWMGSNGHAQDSQTLRFPTDPVTGATVYDQGMIEVPAESGDSTQSASSETIELRFPTDPVTGASLYAEGPVEVTVVSVDYRPDNAEANSADQSSPVEASPSPAPAIEPAPRPADQFEASALRFPTDPVTGATVYDQGMVGEESSEQIADAESVRLPSDPVTGATIFPEDSGAAGGDSGRLSFDPVTGATIYSEAISGSQSSERLPTDPVTGATIYPDAQVAMITTTENDTESAGDTTASEPVDYDLAGIGRQMGTVFGRTSVALQLSVDEASARAAVPVLEQTSGHLKDLSGQIAELPEKARLPVSRVAENSVARLQAVVDTAISNPEVDSVLGSVLDPVMEQFRALAVK